MKTKTTILILIFGAIFIGIYFGLTRDFKKIPQITQQQKTSSQKFENPYLSEAENRSASSYFIENMRKREYQGGEVKIEKKVSDFSKFASFIVSYPSDGLKLFALMNIPKAEKPANGFPVVIVNHGFISPENYSTTNSYKTISQFYANQGFLVLKPDYRGHGNSEGSGGGGLSRIEYAVDVLNLIASIPKIPQADPEKIFLYGHSMGGDVTLRVLEISNNVKAATFWAPAATQFPESLLYFVRRHRPQQLAEIEAAIKVYFSAADYPKLTPVDNTKLIKAPLIIHHGTQDASVPHDWSVELDKKLTENNINHTFYIYNGEDHNFTRGSWGTAANRDLALFKKFL